LTIFSSSLASSLGHHVLYPTQHCIARALARGIPWSAIVEAYRAPVSRKISPSNPHHIRTIVGQNGIGIVLADDQRVLTCYRQHSIAYKAVRKARGTHATAIV